MAQPRNSELTTNKPTDATVFMIDFLFVPERTTLNQTATGLEYLSEIEDRSLRSS